MGKSHILVVDDEPSVLLTYRLLLEQQGYDVTAVLSAREAMRILETSTFDLLLCDLSLEEQYSGFDVVDFGRQRDPGLLAALLTGYATMDAAEKAGTRNIPLLFKPIDIEQFFTTISALLGDGNGQAKASGE
ncbi:MAG TPA: response regulator [Terriglobales bacterium]|nr:response regulator [Terriglobales bacterium]